MRCILARRPRNASPEKALFPNMHVENEYIEHKTDIRPSADLPAQWGSSVAPTATPNPFLENAKTKAAKKPSLPLMVADNHNLKKNCDLALP